MAIEVVMPKLGMAMKEGTVSIWNKKVGESVTKGEVIAEVNSEKIEMELESPADGRMLKITVLEGQGVPPGTVICYIGNSNDRKIREIKISPVAKKMVEAAGLNIEMIQGTGPQGRITKADVEKAMGNQSSVNTKSKPEETKTECQNNDLESVERLTVSGMRKVIATRMYQSLQNSAQLTLNMKADVTELITLQEQMKEEVQKEYEVKLTVTDFVARAVVLSLKQYKQMNSAYIEDQIHIYTQIHLGMAVALDKGLVVPVIRHAQNCSLIELSKQIKLLAEKSRKGELSSEEMKGSTFTITNLGSYGIEYFTPILNFPETGILGVGAIQDTAVFKGEELSRRSLLPLSLTFDHRVLDGAPAAEFLRTMKEYLEEPFRMLL